MDHLFFQLDHEHTHNSCAPPLGDEDPFFISLVCPLPDLHDADLYPNPGEV